MYPEMMLKVHPCFAYTYEIENFLFYFPDIWSLVLLLSEFQTLETISRSFFYGFRCLKQIALFVVYIFAMIY